MSIYVYVKASTLSELVAYLNGLLQFVVAAVLTF